MNGKKYCPLKFAVKKTPGHSSGNQGGTPETYALNFACEKENCAWWFASEEKCARLLMAEVLSQIANHLKR